MSKKNAAIMSFAGLCACRLALADPIPDDPSLSLRPAILADGAAAPVEEAPLMQLLDKAGAARPLSALGLNLYGWIESGYTYQHRPHHSLDAAGGVIPILPGPFNHEVGNHYMLNQVDLRLERIVDSSKFDVGGLMELMYGTDAGFVHSSGLGFNGNDPSDNNSPADIVPDKYRADYQFDITQAYIDVNVPVGNGLKIRSGKFVTLLGYETIDPRSNPFYSHSWLFSALPFTQTGILGSYQFSDQWSVTAGITRGWDQTLEDSGPDGGTCAVDGLGQVAWTPGKQWAIYLNWNVGPQDFGDTSHYRTVLDPIVTWQATERLRFAAEGLYIYDGGMNTDVLTTGVSHAYGDAWGAALYASYACCDYVTLNARVEGYHSSASSFNFAGTNAAVGALAGLPPQFQPATVYAITLGVALTPFPGDPIGKNLLIRPEIRYDFSDEDLFLTGPAITDNYKDQLTFAADVIFKF
jgi:hypothetical protein